MIARLALAVAALLTVAAGPYLTREQLHAKYATPHGHIAVIQGIETWYQDEGRGPALLLVHASSSNQRAWDGVAKMLAKHYRLIRYDIPPQGLSGPIPASVRATIQPTDIAEGLLAQLGIGKVAVVSVSSGGTLAIQLAAKRPDLVTRIVVSNAPSDPVSGAKPAYTKAFLDAQAEAKRTGVQDQAYWNAFVDFFGGDPGQYDKAAREQFYDFARKTPDPDMIALIAKVADHDKAVAAMAGVTQPVLLIWGAKDPLLPLPAMAALERYLTHATVSRVILPDAGHYPPIEMPARFARLVEAYLEAAEPR